MSNSKRSILFLCTGNSVRSLMAEAIANHEQGGALEARSAGSNPTGEPHPLALETIRKNGPSTEGLRSKSWNELVNHRFDLVITLCDAARREACPVFPGMPATAHWGLPDPAAGEASQPKFDAVYDVLVEAIGMLVHAPQETLAERATEASREIRRRFSPKAI